MCIRDRYVGISASKDILGLVTACLGWINEYTPARYMLQYSSIYYIWQERKTKIWNWLKYSCQKNCALEYKEGWLCNTMFTKMNILYQQTEEHNCICVLPGLAVLSIFLKVQDSKGFDTLANICFYRRGPKITLKSLLSCSKKEAIFMFQMHLQTMA